VLPALGRVRLVLGQGRLSTRRLSSFVRRRDEEILHGVVTTLWGAALERRIRDVAAIVGEVLFVGVLLIIDRGVGASLLFLFRATTVL